MSKRTFLVSLIFLIVLILYHPVLTTYFSHDDFFHFKISQVGGKPGGYLYFLGFHPFEERGIAFYRPIFREFLYGPFFIVFGLTSLPFRVFSLFVHFINIYLLFNFLHQLFKDRKLSFLASFFFAISASNVSNLYYLAGGIQTMGATTFILLTLTLFQKYLKTDASKYKIASFVTFLFSLASHEQSIILPILLSGLLFIKYGPRRLIKYLPSLTPYFLTAAVFLYLNYTLIGYSEAELQYQTSFDFKRVLNSYAWYTGWAFGLPEMLIDFVPPGLKLDPRLMRYWGQYFRIIFPAFFVSVSIILLSLVLILIKKQKLFLNRKLVFFAIWYLVGLLPLIFLPSHKSGHYLYVSLPAFWSIISFMVIKSYKSFSPKQPRLAGFLVGALFVSLFSLSATSAVLGNKTYWAAARGRLAEKLIKEVRSKYPNLPKGVIVYFKNDPNYPYVSEDWGGTSKQAYYALNNRDALQLVYKDLSLKVFYEDLGGIPQKLPHEKIHTVVAHIH